MDILNILGTECTPQIIFDIPNKYFEISGRLITFSYPEELERVYKPALEWLENYVRNFNIGINLVFKPDYISTGDIKFVLNVFELMAKLPTSKLLWHFLDDVMKEQAIELTKNLNLQLELVSVEQN